MPARNKTAASEGSHELQTDESKLCEDEIAKLLPIGLTDVLDHPALDGLGSITSASQAPGVLRIKIARSDLPLPA